MQKLLLIIIITISFLACQKEEKAQNQQAPQKESARLQEITIPQDVITNESGLQYIVVEEGNGAQAEKGQEVSVHYAGFLMSGKKFDSSYDRNEPIVFHVGMGEMIPGFDEGVAAMKLGEKRRLFIPAGLAYGEAGIPGVIPPNATLVFDVELVSIKE
ncbi:MAG TPA: FKBP-type peptidyl-prolyl cis-trans isomerase [Caldithrix abyssi]|uniref:Peptidyl-prolyl cis-trans isomerase n=1 Tax=Caldithrix abyssi TaxID=187145 RepID=A0A7V4U0Y3_CALAY|nr:FKBP-type peptidyl-prolyl cis-trans isomerase [Caldithrix abyssi]